jgi:hypothetical protein
MYIAHGFFFAVFFAINHDYADKWPVMQFFEFGGVFIALALACGAVGLVLSLVGMKKDPPSPLKMTLIVKLALIPWYGFNVYYAICIIGGMLNPFLWFIIPFEIAVMVSVTWILMILTGVQDVVYVCQALKDKRLAPSPAVIAGLIMQFIFVLDVAGAGLLVAAAGKAAQASTTSSSPAAPSSAPY